MFWSFLWAPMPAAETKPGSQLASAVFKSFWRITTIFFYWDLVTSCFWLCRLGISMWFVYDFIQKQNWGYFALLPKVVQTLNPLQNARMAEYLWFISSVLIFLFVQAEIIILRTKSYIWFSGCEGFKLLELLCLSVQPTQTPRDTLVQSLNLLSLVKPHFPGLNRSWAGTCCHHELLY